MKYNWTINDVLKQVEILREKLKNEQDPQRKFYLEKVLDTTEYLIQEKLLSTKKPSESTKQRLHNINIERLSYGRYYSIIQEFYFRLSSLEEQIEQVEDLFIKLFGEEFDMADLTGSYISNDKALSLTAKFYTDLDSDLHSYFNEAFTQRFTTLRFKASKDTGSKECDGTTTFIDCVRKNYISIKKTKSASKIFTLIHEYGHAIGNLINPEGAYSNDDGLFEEVDGLLPELIALDENIGNLNPLYLAYLKYSTLISYYNNADALVLHNIILNAWHENGYRLDKKLKEQLAKEYDIDDEVLSESLDTTLFEEGTYVISYLVAIELLHIYKKDKHRALTLYKQFLSAPADKDILPFISTFITLNDSIFQEATDIIEEMKLQLERYGDKHV